LCSIWRRRFSNFRQLEQLVEDFAREVLGAFPHLWGIFDDVEQLVAHCQNQDFQDLRIKQDFFVRPDSDNFGQPIMPLKKKKYSIS
jgi:hypothetical protein